MSQPGHVTSEQLSSLESLVTVLAFGVPEARYVTNVEIVGDMLFVGPGGVV